MKELNNHDMEYWGCNVSVVKGKLLISFSKHKSTKEFMHQINLCYAKN